MKKALTLFMLVSLLLCTAACGTTSSDATATPTRLRNRLTQLLHQFPKRLGRQNHHAQRSGSRSFL